MPDPTETMLRRVALMIESDGPGGAESVVFALAQGLRAKGIDVRPVILAGGPGWLSGKLAEAGFPVCLPHLRIGLDPLFALQLAAWARRERIQLMHGHEFTMGFYAGVAGQLSGVPHIITMHGGTRYASTRKLRTLLRFSAKRASKLVGVSESTCQHLADSLKLPRTDIELTPNGVQPLQGDRDRIRRELGIGPGTRLLLAVGNLYAVKGHRTLVEAMAMLRHRQDLPPWRLVIAGRGQEQPFLESLIRDSLLEQHVQLLGLRNDIPDLLAGADGWVMPSLSEGLPMALLEAMFAGLPIVATAVGGIPGLIEPGKSGWLVEAAHAPPLADAIADLLSDTPKAQRFGLAARAVAHSDYSLDRMVSRHLALYEAALSAD